MAKSTGKKRKASKSKATNHSALFAYDREFQKKIRKSYEELWRNGWKDPRCSTWRELWMKTRKPIMEGTIECYKRLSSQELIDLICFWRRVPFEFRAATERDRAGIKTWPDAGDLLTYWLVTNNLLEYAAVEHGMQRRSLVEAEKIVGEFIQKLPRVSETPDDPPFDAFEFLSSGLVGMIRDFDLCEDHVDQAVKVVQEAEHVCHELVLKLQLSETETQGILEGQQKMPQDALWINVVLEEFLVSSRTLYRYRKKKKLTGYRYCDSSQKQAYRYSRAELEKHFQYKGR